MKLWKACVQLYIVFKLTCIDGNVRDTRRDENNEEEYGWSECSVTSGSVKRLNILVESNRSMSVSQISDRIFEYMKGSGTINVNGRWIEKYETETVQCITARSKVVSCEVSYLLTLSTLYSSGSFLFSKLMFKRMQLWPNWRHKRI